MAVAWTVTSPRSRFTTPVTCSHRLVSTRASISRCSRTARFNADSSILVTVQEDRDAQIWVAPDGDAGRATQLTSVSTELDGSVGVAWTPDGKHLIVGAQDGSAGPGRLFLVSTETGERRPLTSPPPASETVDVSPSVSPGAG